jgi:hypothetical protein
MSEFEHESDRPATVVNEQLPLLVPDINDNDVINYVDDSSKATLPTSLLNNNDNDNKDNDKNDSSVAALIEKTTDVSSCHDNKSSTTSLSSSETTDVQHGRTHDGKSKL